MKKSFLVPDWTPKQFSHEWKSGLVFLAGSAIPNDILIPSFSLENFDFSHDLLLYKWHTPNEVTSLTWLLCEALTTRTIVHRSFPSFFQTSENLWCPCRSQLEETQIRSWNGLFECTTLMEMVLSPGGKCKWSWILLRKWSIIAIKVTTICQIKGQNEFLKILIKIETVFCPWMNSRKQPNKTQHYHWCSMKFSRVNDREILTIWQWQFYAITRGGDG